MTVSAGRWLEALVFVGCALISPFTQPVGAAPGPALFLCKPDGDLIPTPSLEPRLLINALGGGHVRGVRGACITVCTRCV